MADDNTSGSDGASLDRRAHSTLEESSTSVVTSTSPLRALFVAVPAVILLAAVTNLLGLWSFPGQVEARRIQEEQAAAEAREKQAPAPLPDIVQPPEQRSVAERRKETTVAPPSGPEPRKEQAVVSPSVPEPRKEQAVAPPSVPEPRKQQAVVQPQAKPAATPPRQKNARPLALRESREAFPPDWGIGEHEADAVPAFDAAAVAARVASADAQDGANTFRMCGICHSSGKGDANKVGPNLWGILDRDIAAASDFRYSRSLREREGAWSYTELAAFLNNPRTHTPGTSMAFRGIEDRTKLANLLAYLRTLADDPRPLPAR